MFFFFLEALRLSNDLVPPAITSIISSLPQETQCDDIDVINKAIRRLRSRFPNDPDLTFHLTVAAHHASMVKNILATKATTLPSTSDVLSKPRTATGSNVSESYSASSVTVLDEMLQPPTVEAESKQRQLDKDQRKILMNMKKERVQKEKEEKKTILATKATSLQSTSDVLSEPSRTSANVCDSSSAPSPSVLDELLKPPTIFSRSVKQRAYKQANYGVLTSERLINECQKVEAENKQKQLAKDQRKILMNIKKERVQKEKEEKKARKEQTEKKKAQLNAEKEAKLSSKRKASEQKILAVASKKSRKS